MSPTSVVHHLVVIDPPNERRDTWLAVCSQKDFNQSYLNNVDAHLGASQHVSDMRTLNALERGDYEFEKRRNE